MLNLKKFNFLTAESGAKADQTQDSPEPKETISNGALPMTTQSQSPAQVAQATKVPESGQQGNKVAVSSKITSLIGKSVKMSGDLVLAESIKIDGTIMGNVDVDGNESILVLSPGAIIEGELKVARAVIAGTVKGNIVANQVTIYSTGKVEGDISYTVLQIADGSEINGRITKKKEYASFENVRSIAGN